jgi:hypothetical protein
MTDASADPIFEPLPGYHEYPRVPLLRRKPLSEIATFR